MCLQVRTGPEARHREAAVEERRSVEAEAHTADEAERRMAVEADGACRIVEKVCHMESESESEAEAEAGAGEASRMEAVQCAAAGDYGGGSEDTGCREEDLPMCRLSRFRSARRTLPCAASPSHVRRRGRT